MPKVRRKPEKIATNSSELSIDCLRPKPNSLQPSSDGMRWPTLQVLPSFQLLPDFCPALVELPRGPVDEMEFSRPGLACSS